MSRRTIASALHGTVVGVQAEPGQAVAAGDALVLIEAMKMEHTVAAPCAGIVRSVQVAVGEVVQDGQALLDLDTHAAPARAAVDYAPAPPVLRADLQSSQERHALTLDAARAQAIARRHATGLRSVRENIADLVDAGSFTEYGALAVAAQRSRRSLDDLMRNTPADGLVTGVGSVNAAQFGPERARCALLGYDYTVLAGTQGVWNHAKADRLLDLAERARLPLVLLAEGGGGRPGDTDWMGVAGLDCSTFERWARLSAQVPRIGVVAGRCFAGNAALLGCSDVVIAVRGASIGMGGPAMIEGGGLGVVAPDAVGPTDVLAPNGVIDLLVDDEAAAVAAARQYLGYFQGVLAQWSCAEQQALREGVPANRNAVYEVRAIVERLFDSGSVLELRRDFGVGVLTALARIEGRPLGVIANRVHHLGGALDAPGCDKLARFMQLCDAFGLPIVSLIDTPGFMVGPASEATAMVRHSARVFVNAAALRVPLLAIVLRRGYGLGAMAMAGGGFHVPRAIAAWPSGEFGPMGLEGAVRLGFRKELEAAPEAEREALFERMVGQARERGAALNMASHLEIDDVIDPAESRAWLARGLRAHAAGELPPRRGLVDAW